MTKMRPNISHYCQKCLAANPLGQEFCARCGTRLMIVVEPSAARYETGPASLSTDEHLLERISAAETRVARLAERLESGLGLLLNHSQIMLLDRALILALIGLLAEEGIIERERLGRMWMERCDQEAIEHKESVQRNELRLRILATAKVADKQVFEQLVNEGFVLIEDKQIRPGITKLQRAAELAEENAPLNLFIGEHFFRRGKTKQARAYLAKAHTALPDDLRISLLLGLTCADDGEVALAKDLLSSATAHGTSSFAGHCGLGWVFVAEKKWRRALGEFKRALTVRPSAEAHYVLGCLYFELNRDALAVRHLRKATEMDGGYAAAFSLLAQAYERTGRKELARQALVKAGRKNGSLFHVTKSGALRLMTGADKRLADALREDALATDFTNGH